MLTLNEPEKEKKTKPKVNGKKKIINVRVEIR